MMTAEEIERWKLIGGSDIGPILGESIFSKEIDVWRRIIEETMKRETASMTRGKNDEDRNREIFTTITGAELLGPVTMRHPTISFGRLSLDDVARYPDTERVLELKRSNWRMISEFAKHPYGVLPEYRLQVMWYMGATGRELADIATMFVDDEKVDAKGNAPVVAYKISTIPFDPELYEDACTKVVDWYNRHIKTGIPPDPDGSESSGRWLAERYAARRPMRLQATAEQEAIARKIQEWESEAEQLTKDAEKARQFLTAAAGDTGGIDGEFFSLAMDVRETKSTSWKSVAEEGRVSPEIVRKYTKVSVKTVPKLTWKDAR